MADFLEPVIADGLCRLTPLPSQLGSWQVFMMDADDAGSLEGDAMPPPVPPPVGGVMPAGAPPVTPLDGQPALPAEPEIIDIQLHKVAGSMGLSIVAAKVIHRTITTHV